MSDNMFTIKNISEKIFYILCGALIAIVFVALYWQKNKDDLIKEVVLLDGNQCTDNTDTALDKDASDDVFFAGCGGFF